MNGPFEFADGFCHLVWRHSWQASILIILVLAANWMFRRRLSHAWRHGLWLLVLVRLAWPYPPPSALSVFNLFASDNEHVVPGETAPSVPSTPGNSIQRPQEAMEAVTVPGPGGLTPAVPGGSAVDRTRARPQAISSVSTVRPIPAATLLFLMWLGGVVFLGGRVGWEAARLAKTIRRLRPVTDSAILNELEDCKQSMNVTTPLIIIESVEADNPMLHGFIRPRLLLPEGLMACLSPGQRRHVFLHELAHVRRLDILVNWLATGLQILHWFNPLVWLALSHMRDERELTADSLVLAGARENERLQYGETLLKLVKFFRVRGYLPSLAGILESKGRIESRILEIANFGGPTRRPLLAFVVLAALAVTTLTDAQRASVEPANPVGDPNSEPGGVWHRRASGPTQNGPTARIGHSMIWTGKELIVWGGGSQSVVCNDGSRYELATDTWRPISPHNAPSPRWLHAAVWTGTEMIVWGGRAQFENLQARHDGARYNPTTDTWMPLSAKEAPTARSQMAVVWTGTEMLIWGGAGEEWVIESPGARYDPRTDIWKPITETSAPEPRMEPSAVWTGSEMLVWGGVRYSPDQITFNTGGRYDPTRDLWIPLPTNGAPARRTGHTAVWTGREMIVWGGHEDIEFMNTGARFNLAENIWASTTLVRAPQRRMSHGAVWTGFDMIIWGGQASPYDLTGTGARYDPEADEWSRVTNIGAPAARIFQRDDSAVWTSEGMLIFGGGTGRREFDSSFLWTPPRATTTAMTRRP